MRNVTYCTPCIALAIKIQNAEANRFSAVPLIVWSALRVIEANA